MSTDQASAEPVVPAAEPGGARRFRRALIGTLGGLAVLVTALGIAGTVQGPRVTSAEVDSTRVVQLAGQSLRIELNQAVAELNSDGVTVSPAAPVSITHDASTITVTFDAPLAYSREYTVTIPGVVGAFTSAPSAITHSFTTADEFAFSLQRRSHDGEMDVVLRRPLDRAGEQEIVFRAPRIKSFARHGEAVAAVTVNEDASNSVYIAVPGADAPQEITFPTVGNVRALAASATNPLLGFVVTSTEINGERLYENALFTVDLSGVVESGVRLVEDSSGAPMSVMDWAFVPGTTSLIVQDYEQTLFLLDLAGTAPATPVGRHGELRGFIPGTTTLIVADPDHGSLIDLAAGTTTPIELPQTDLATDRYLGKATVLAADGEHLLELSSPTVDGDASASNSVLVLVATAGSRALYEPPANSRILRHCVSPNGQFVAVETVGDSSAPDRYPGAAGFTNTLTLLVEIETARVVSGLSGGFSDWCGA